MAHMKCRHCISVGREMSILEQKYQSLSSKRGWMNARRGEKWTTKNRKSQSSCGPRKGFAEMILR